MFAAGKSPILAAIVVLAQLGALATTSTAVAQSGKVAQSVTVTDSNIQRSSAFCSALSLASSSRGHSLGCLPDTHPVLRYLLATKSGRQDRSSASQARSLYISF
jgi:hypothetical protein